MADDKDLHLGSRWLLSLLGLLVSVLVLVGGLLGGSWDYSQWKDVIYATAFYIGTGGAILTCVSSLGSIIRPVPIRLVRTSEGQPALEARLISAVPMLVTVWCGAVASALLLPTHALETIERGRRLRGLPLGVLLVGCIVLAFVFLFARPVLRPILRITPTDVSVTDGRTARAFRTAWENVGSVERWNRGTRSWVPQPRIVLRVRGPAGTRAPWILAVHLRSDPRLVAQILQHLHEEPELRRRLGDFVHIDDLIAAHREMRIERFRREVAARKAEQERPRFAPPPPPTAPDARQQQVANPRGPGAVPRATPGAPRPLIEQTDSRRPSTTGKVLLWILVPASAVALVYLATRDSGTDPDQALPPAPDSSAVGFADLVEEIRLATGSTQVTSVEMNPAVTIILVPERPNNGREIHYARVAPDGGLMRVAALERQRQPFDLATIDNALVARLCGETSSSCSIRITRSAPRGGRVILEINEVEYDRKGREIGRDP